MYALSDRAKAMEDKFAYDQGQQFRTECRRNKLVGLWAASVLGVDDASGYAGNLVDATVAGATLANLATKLRHDFDTAGIAVNDDELQDRFRDCLRLALHELETA